MLTGNLTAETLKNTDQDKEVDKRPRGEVGAEQELLRIHSLGCRHCEGKDVEQDYQKARQCFEEAAAEGYAPSLFNLGCMYHDRKGVNLDYKKACEYYEQAAAKGHVRAQYNLGYMYRHGKGVKRDYQKARECFEKAAAKGHVKAQYNLGFMYSNGKGIKQDYQKAHEYYEQAAAKGHVKAQYNLGFMYSNGKGIKQDYQKAREYYEQAVASGYVKALYSLGRMYLECKGVEQDLNKVSFYFRRILEKSCKASLDAERQKKVIINLLNCYSANKGNSLICYNTALGLSTRCDNKQYQELSYSIVNTLYKEEFNTFIQLLQQDTDENIKKALSLLSERYRRQLALKIRVAFNCLQKSHVNERELPSEIIVMILALRFGDKITMGVLNGILLSKELAEERAAYWNINKLEKIIELYRSEPLKISRVKKTVGTFFPRVPIQMKRKLNDTVQKEIKKISPRQETQIDLAHKEKISYVEALPRFMKRK